MMRCKESVVPLCMCVSVYIIGTGITSQGHRNYGHGHQLARVGAPEHAQPHASCRTVAATAGAPANTGGNYAPGSNKPCADAEFTRARSRARARRPVHRPGRTARRPAAAARAQPMRFRPVSRPVDSVLVIASPSSPPSRSSCSLPGEGNLVVTCRATPHPSRVQALHTCSSLSGRGATTLLSPASKSPSLRSPALGVLRQPAYSSPGRGGAPHPARASGARSS